jgi:hypothetical protein
MFSRSLTPFGTTHERQSPDKKAVTPVLHALTLDALKTLDLGKSQEAFQLHLRRLAQDCLDRPAESKARTLTMQVGVVPVTEGDGTCERVRLQIHFTSAVPKHRTRVYDMALRKNATLVFSEDSPENFDQTTIFDDGER